ncbi:MULTISPECIES: cysteine hydrolase family protein [unclassified Janthinobacterium]|uniref:cysteine hydrolase family protein n=1 Tax=unclassified Janthinobacterium TaxID=2610881 RepID=UPI00034A5775|nr:MULTISPECIES: cysteine hydrolase family protein [unclassified Janthinobacterium]MEC5162665.1 nicotinamidase-related amidase [Janthinobacterium sp. CG_S6]
MPTELPALIIIDMQKAMTDPAAGARNNPQAEACIAALLRAWRGAGGVVVHVRHMSTSPASLFWPGRPGVEFQEALAPLPGAHVVEKNVPDAFINSALERWLRVRGVGAVVLVGVSTNNSVEGSARSASNLGFDVTVVADACFAFDKTDYAGTRRNAADVHAMALANLDGEHARITSTAALLATLPGLA